MPRPITFEWTSRALVAGHKRCTRRGWQPSTAAGFRAGDLVTAYDHSPRVHGVPIAQLRLILTPYEERPGDLPDADFIEEGFAYLRRFPGATDEQRAQALRLTSDDHWFSWKTAAGGIWVVRFELVSVTPAGIALLGEPELRELAGRLAIRGAQSLPLPAIRAIVATHAGYPGAIASAPRPEGRR